MRLKILDKYLAWRVAYAICIITLALVGLEIFFTLVNELRFVGKGDYGFLQAAVFVGLSLPSKIYSLFPWATLVGALLGLSQLSKYGELTIMQTSGMSRLNIAKNTVLGTCLILLIIGFIGEVIAPYTDNFATLLKTKAVSSGQGMVTNHGVWLKKDNDIIKVGSIDNANNLTNVTIYQLNGSTLEAIIKAETGSKEPSGWTLKNVQKTVLHKDKISKEFLVEYKVARLIDEEIVDTMSLKHPEYLGFTTLWKVIKVQKQSNLNTSRFELALYNKVANPLLIIIMAILAVPFAFKKLRTLGISVNLIKGLLLSFVIHNAMKIIPQFLVTQGVGCATAVFVPVVLIGSIAIISLCKDDLAARIRIAIQAKLV